MRLWVVMLFVVLLLLLEGYLAQQVDGGRDSG